MSTTTTPPKTNSLVAKLMSAPTVNVYPENGGPTTTPNNTPTTRSSSQPATNPITPGTRTSTGASPPTPIVPLSQGGWRAKTSSLQSTTTDAPRPTSSPPQQDSTKPLQQESSATRELTMSQTLRARRSQSEKSTASSSIPSSSTRQVVAPDTYSERSMSQTLRSRRTPSSGKHDLPQPPTSPVSSSSHLDTTTTPGNHRGSIIVDQLLSAPGVNLYPQGTPAPSSHRPFTTPVGGSITQQQRNNGHGSVKSDGYGSSRARSTGAGHDGELGRAPGPVHTDSTRSLVFNASTAQFEPRARSSGNTLSSMLSGAQLGTTLQNGGLGLSSAEIQSIVKSGVDVNMLRALDHKGIADLGVSSEVSRDKLMQFLKAA